MPVEMLNRHTLADQVYNQIKRRITRREFTGGSRLVADQLARELKVSVTLVRETLRRLERDGLIENHPHKGATVVNPTRQDVLDLFEVRRLLEPAAVRGAAAHANAEQLAAIGRMIDDGAAAFEAQDFPAFVQCDWNFHRLLAESCGSRQLAQTMHGMLDRVAAIISHTVEAGAVRNAAAAIVEHRRILDAIAAHDAHAAEEQMRNHLEHSLNNAIESGSV